MNSFSLTARPQDDGCRPITKWDGNCTLALCIQEEPCRPRARVDCLPLPTGLKDKHGRPVSAVDSRPNSCQDQRQGGDGESVLNRPSLTGCTEREGRNARPGWCSGINFRIPFDGPNFEARAVPRTPPADGSRNPTLDIPAVASGEQIRIPGPTQHYTGRGTDGLIIDKCGDEHAALVQLDIACRVGRVVGLANEDAKFLETCSDGRDAARERKRDTGGGVVVTARSRQPCAIRRIRVVVDVSDGAREIRLF